MAFDFGNANDQQKILNSLTFGDCIILRSLELKTY